MNLISLLQTNYSFNGMQCFGWRANLGTIVEPIKMYMTQNRLNTNSFMRYFIYNRSQKIRNEIIKMCKWTLAIFRLYYWEKLVFEKYRIVFGKMSCGLIGNNIRRSHWKFEMLALLLEFFFKFKSNCAYKCYFEWKYIMFGRYKMWQMIF